MNTPKRSVFARLEKAIQAAILWIASNQERAWAVLGVTVVTVVVGILVLRNRAQMNEDAWNQLGTVQGHIMQGRTQEALKSVNEWESRFTGTAAASYAKFIKADLLMKTTDYAGASQIYSDLAVSANPAPLRPLAMAAQVNAEDAAGHIPQAKAAAQAFLDRYPDHFLAGSVLWSQAHLAEKGGDATGVQGLYERFSLLYPQNPWQDLLQALPPGRQASRAPAR